MGETVIYFDYSAAFILSMLLISCVFRRMLRGRVNRDFFYVVLVAFFTTLIDIIAITLDNGGRGNYELKMIFHTLYLLLHSLNTPLYLIYLIDTTDTWHKLIHRKLTLWILFAPFALVVVFLIVNFFTPVVFYFSSNGAYQRGEDFFVVYCVAAIYFAIALWYLFSYKSLFSKGEFLGMVGVFPVVLTAVLIQMFVPELAIEMFAISVTFLFIALIVLRPEEIVDTESGLMKKNAFTRDMHRAQISEKKVDIILINITNYRTLSNMLGYKSMRELIGKASTKLNLINSASKSKGEVYHIGNGQFRLVVDRHYSDITMKLVKEIREQLSKRIEFHHMELDVVANVCLAKWPEEISDVDSLLIFGNDLNDVPFTGEIMYAHDLFRKDYYDIMRDIDDILENAVSGQKFEIFYQPIYSVKDKKFISAEALIKLHDEKYGNISPEIFIPAAEKSGIIHKIGAFVLDEVFAFVGSREFEEIGLEYIEVNLSVEQCVESTLVEDMKARLEKFKVKPSQINLEVTETVVSSETNVMMDNIWKLFEAGFTFSLDDYGTGYSNIQRISQMPLYIVKIDKSFTETEDNPRLKVVVENTFRMIKDLNMKIVVEGIENEEKYNAFASLGADYIQGYYFSKPKNRQEFVRFIDKMNNNRSYETGELK